MLRPISWLSYIFMLWTPDQVQSNKHNYKQISQLSFKDGDIDGTRQSWHCWLGKGAVGGRQCPVRRRSMLTSCEPCM